MKNNLFQYATKELSQDAMLCWMINFINYPDSPLYPLGVSVLDMFLGKNKPKEYKNVSVIRQYKKIDVLVLFNDRYALIIEDKTNTAEHSNQIKRYKEALQSEYPNHEILTAYIKTGIMYDNDFLMLKKADVIVGLHDMTSVLQKFADASDSDILKDYVEYLNSLINYRKTIDAQLNNREYDKALTTYYGQFKFLDRIFSNRSKGTAIGKAYIGDEKDELIYIDQIYEGTNNGGTPWAQYCFWGEKYPVQIKNSDRLEYHYLFWRIDCTAKGFYIALRHYDENAHSKINESLNQRKREVYHTFRVIADKIYDDYYKEKNTPALYSKIGKRDNYKESDLLYIPIKNLNHLSFDEIKELLLKITNIFVNR